MEKELTFKTHFKNILDTFNITAQIMWKSHKLYFFTSTNKFSQLFKMKIYLKAAMFCKGGTEQLLIYVWVMEIACAMICAVN